MIRCSTGKRCAAFVISDRRRNLIVY